MANHSMLNKDIEKTLNNSGRGFQAQQTRNDNREHSDTLASNPRQSRSPPPGKRRMNLAKRDLYPKEK